MVLSILSEQSHSLRRNNSATLLLTNRYKVATMNTRIALLLFSACFITESSGDGVDDAMVSDISTYNVRGASITFFDSVSATEELQLQYVHRKQMSSYLHASSGSN